MMTALADQAGLAGADTFPRFLRACAASFGVQPAIRLAGESLPDDEISFAELESRSAGLARRLLAEGAGKGARIGFICGNGPAFAVILAAIARIGAIAIPVSTLARGAELVRILRQSDMAGLIVQPRLLGRDLIARLG
ncbi:MAG TPA: AMP-binding protein, partial [Novosphingobium sp.]|nr:AMP-binding protein [Novosphingobium sp.]